MGVVSDRLVLVLGVDTDRVRQVVFPSWFKAERKLPGRGSIMNHIITR